MKIIIDANIALATVMPLPYSEVALALFSSWKQERVNLCAPTLWDYECANALHRAFIHGMITQRQAELAIEALFDLNVARFAPTLMLEKAALTWAQRVKEISAYDAAYLALADEVHTELWSADGKLVRAAQRAGVGWIHWVTP